MPFGPVIQRTHGDKVILETTDGFVVIEFRERRGGKSPALAFVECPESIRIKRPEHLTQIELDQIKNQSNQLTKGSR